MAPKKRVLNRRSNSPSKRELEIENARLNDMLRREDRGIIAKNVASILNSLFTMLWIVAVAVCSVLAIKYLAGRQTDANIVLNLLGNINFANGALGTASLASLYWAVSERKLRKGTVEHMHKRIKECEESTNPGRTSSGLTSSGATNPDDI